MKLSTVFKDLMRKHHRQAVLLGGDMASTPEEFFGFHYRQVKTVHFHKQGVGKGIWFRLCCGRVIDDIAKPCQNDPELYDYGAKWSYA
jgi:hypothetical protein